MSYPMAPEWRFGVFLAKLESLGVRSKRLPGRLKNGNGDTYQVMYLERVEDGERYWVTTPRLDMGEHIEYDMIRQIIRRLKLNPADFNLVIG